MPGFYWGENTKKQSSVGLEGFVQGKRAGEDTVRASGDRELL